MAERVLDTASARAIRPVLWAIIPTALAFAIEFFFPSDTPRWLLLNLAVLISAWRGGLGAGIVSTFLSAALVSWFVPAANPQFAETRQRLAGATFLAIGIALSFLLERLKRAQRALESTAAELEEAQRLAHIGSWTWDFRTQTGWWSPELYRIHRRDPSLPPPGPEDLVNFFAADSARALRVAADQLYRHGTPFELELETTAPDGEHTWVATHGEGVRDSSGRVIGLRGTSQDITRLKTLERLKEEWTSVVAHDLRQPINVIASCAEMLPEFQPGGISKSAATCIRHIRSAAHSLNRMVSDLIDVSRLESHRLSLERTWLDPAQLVRETLDHFRHITERSRIVVATDAALGRVFVDRDRFEQILGNLLSNAVKYGDPNGEIQVRVMQRADEVTCAVANRGPGISSEELSHLFTRFTRSTTARSVSGLGLGLYIARGLVEAHGGRIWAESVPGDTTTFYFTLPQHAQADAA